MKLEGQQKEAYNIALEYINKGKHFDNPRIRIGGVPGSGKTTMIKAVIEELYGSMRNVLFTSYTGTAVRRMRKEGLPARTIHSSLMKPYKEPLYNGRELVYNNGIPVYYTKWDFIDELPDNIIAIVNDEYSFNNEYIDENLARLAKDKGIPLFGIGDPDQLPPVTGESCFKHEDLLYFMEETHRQIKDSPLNRLICDIRVGKLIQPDDYSYYSNSSNRIKGSGKVVFYHNYDSPTKLYKYYKGLFPYFDAILVNSNNKRNIITDVIRNKIYGYYGDYPYPGEKLVCRKNNHNLCLDIDYPLTNGTVGYSMGPIGSSDINNRDKTYTIDFRPYDVYESYFDRLVCDHEFLILPFSSNKRTKYNKGNKLEYAYAQTVHLSQGAEYDSVGYIEDYFPNKEFGDKLKYVAYSRAKKQLNIFI